MLADVRYAVKWLLRSPGFTVVAVLSLAVGIGFNTALFSIVDALLFRPLPIADPARLVDVYTRGGDGDTYATSSYPDYLDFQAGNRVFTGLLAYSPSIGALKAGDRSRMALGEVVTGNYFQVLGISAALGRTLLPEDDRAGAPRVTVISHAVWARDFARDPAALGRTLLIHGQPYTIVGVAPEAFTGLVPMLQPEMWTPIAWVEDVEPAGIQDVVPSPTGTSRLDRRGQRWLFMKGRLKDGETAARAQANLQAIMSQLAAAHPRTNDRRPIATAANVRIHPEADRMLRPVAAGLGIAIGLVLLVACANVANMLLARASGRQREIGIRLAIGASRRRLIQQLLTESLVLAALGAAAGIMLASFAIQVIAALPLPLPVPVALDLHVDGRVMLFTTVVATAAGLLAGLMPALRATRVNLAADMKGEATIARAGRRWTIRDGLVVAQTAVTLVLLVTAGLLIRSILQAQRVDLGFRAEGAAALGTELGLIGYTEARAAALFERAAERVSAIPGVTSVARAVRQPLAINYNRNTIFFPERSLPDDRGTPVSATWVDEHYFKTLNVPLVRGRDFTAADTPSSARVAIVNDAFVRRYWPGEEPLGRRFRTRAADGPEFEVVGVVADYKVETVGEKPTPYIHYALGQRQFTGEVLIARTASDARGLLAAMRRELLALEPNAVFLDNQTMEAQVAANLLPARLAAQTLALVGVVATLLAAIGLYGVIAYAVGRRTREIGIRIALGATPGDVLGMVMRQGLGIVAGGLTVGLVLSWIAARAIASALYGVGAADPAAWTGAVAVMLGSAALANYLPARRAARVDPSIALRAS
ncbi:MAG TPA: ABC transporter permease [Vicinamibacterales bacterium]|nr:ABC transporter permease [Vicinamibacterales bacterium]